jgi:hypothetical protein
MIRHYKGVLKGFLAFMQHFELVVWFFDVTLTGKFVNGSGRHEKLCQIEMLQRLLAAFCHSRNIPWQFKGSYI